MLVSRRVSGPASHEAYGKLLQGLIASLRGDYGQAIACQERAVSAGQASGLPFLEAAALCGLGTAYLDIGTDYTERGIESHARAQEIMEHPRGAVMGTMIWADLGFCAMAMGQTERAGELFDKGFTVSTATKLLARPPLLVGSAFLQLGSGNTDEGAALVTEAREFVEERQMKHFYPLVELAAGQVAATRGDGSEALEHRALGEQLALGMQMRPMVLQLRLGAAQVLEGSARGSEAAAKRASARGMIEEIGSLFESQEMRKSYLENASKKLQ